ncbi:MAG: transcriptional repressor [Nitrospirae bacterium]|nr:transcriptional repressor [Nitrospirota bacterium]
MSKAEAKAAFARYLQSNGLKGSRQRERILEAFLNMPPHLTAEDLHRRVSRMDAGIGLATVYRALRLFCEAGLAKQRHFEEGRSRFEQAFAHDHHDHLICVGCGRIVEFECQEIENLQVAMATRHGFTLTHHRLELFGYCPDCAPAAEGQGP